MTPILRKSKESARRQRSRPESEKSSDVPHSKPLAERARPLPSYPDRKRSYRDSGSYRGHYDHGPPRKYSRPSYGPPPRYDRRSPGSYPPRREPVSRSYEDYLRTVRGDPGSSGRPTSSYYNDDYLYDRRDDRPSYDRSVDDFLRRTGGGGGRRYRH